MFPRNNDLFQKDNARPYKLRIVSLFYIEKTYVFFLNPSKIQLKIYG